MKQIKSTLSIYILFMVLLSGCERLEMPVISDAKAVETSPSVVAVSAVMKSKQIDECGVVYSTKSTTPTPSSNEGIMYGTLDADGQFSATLTLATNTTYHFVFFATNEIGTAMSEPIELTTSLFVPDRDDNPLPNP